MSKRSTSATAQKSRRLRSVVVPPCDMCGRKQTQYGAVEWGPPRTFIGAEGIYCRKWHVCHLCYRRRHNNSVRVDV